MYSKFITVCLLVFTILLSGSASGQNVDVDISACEKILPVLKAMKNGSKKEKVSLQLDSILNKKPYEIMFMHYNRSWRPNHLPQEVFKKMIMSLEFKDEYTLGTNQRADKMLSKWSKFYNDLDLYEKNLNQLQQSDIDRLINVGVSFAQSWLPEDWRIPDFYFFIHPNGGSNGFAIGDNQGYDFFALPRDLSGNLMLDDLVKVISHESHHLGLNLSYPENLSSSDSLAFRFLSMFIGEGTATKFINNADGGCVPRVDTTKIDGSLDEIKDEWENYTMQEPEMFSRLVSTFERAFSGQMTEKDLTKEMKEYWFTGGVVYPVYFVGSELFGAIYIGMGKEAAFEAMKNPRRMFELYNKAIDRRPDILKDCPKIPETSVKNALLIGHTPE